MCDLTERARSELVEGLYDCKGHGVVYAVGWEDQEVGEYGCGVWCDVRRLSLSWRMACIGVAG